jgi:hypothetical protein
LLGGYDIGLDGQVNTSDEGINPVKASIGSVTPGYTGRLAGSYVLAGVKPY